MIWSLFQPSWQNFFLGGGSETFGGKLPPQKKKMSGVNTEYVSNAF